MAGEGQTTSESDRAADAPRTLDVRAFRDASGRFATGIVIVSAKRSAGTAGLAIVHLRRLVL
jgi:flavin reductase (DIM6/NTAB) family NADH-FMN oxidoreductase RutF